MVRARVTPAVTPGWLVWRIPGMGAERFQWQAWGEAGTRHGWTTGYEEAIRLAERERDRLRWRHAA